MDKTNIINDLDSKYSKSTIVIHWFTSILILTLFPLGKFMEGIPVSEKILMIKLHVILGIIVFILTLIRSYLFFTSKRPESLKTGSKWNDKLAEWIHNAFYFLLMGISISGITTMFIGGYSNALLAGTFDIIKTNDLKPLKAHGLLATIMMILLLMHVIGVVKHYILTRENTLKRIS
ncbi:MULTISPECIES: cytochrome b [unclassified Tenacibaculum]|uniref:cytochrome b n=1 Tax=unclassified Tenacibaculum TaxID=2635139 RepID=UPI001F190B5A|nr:MULTISPECIES: cytochrome b/b6 domain-containing protein [unclassified Tenacibaculum]MCF2875750.1 cytochrome b/b6 domain-containing protein [Tenacibaculum sp. Cn5-1]MCF2935826.1 cytochrome b/b6 domain-containing protein [Tenacibaculum sp. Cn5-34]MCG7512386.1 cytochrome b/b6 domain-containing protein [Tenacibaculum sp. Cn5-46]